MGLILSLDSFFPYDTLGFLQGWVSVIWNLVLVLLQLSGVRVLTNPNAFTERPWVFLHENRLFISGNTGAMTLAIYWPSSGIVSMLIYTMVIITLLIKIDAPMKRKLVYAVIGAIGTFFVNVIRVFLISYYVAFISIDVNAFHEVIGEVLFLPWVGIFLVSVLRAEGYIGWPRLTGLPKLPRGTQPR
jgi:thaumarchaeosortase